MWNLYPDLLPGPNSIERSLQQESHKAPLYTKVTAWGWDYRVRRCSIRLFEDIKVSQTQLASMLPSLTFT